MSDTITLTLDRDDAHFLNLCLNDLQTIFTKGTSESEAIEQQARESGQKLKNIQEEILKQI